jgi:hypothetical protein
MTALRFFIRHHPVALAVFVLALVGTVLFGARTVMRAVHFHDPAHREQALEPWMTPRYVGMSWGLPPEELGPALGLPDERPTGRPPTMADIAADTGVSIAELQIRVEAAKAQHDAERGDPPPPPPPPPEPQP